MINPIIFALATLITTARAEEPSIDELLATCPVGGYDAVCASLHGLRDAQLREANQPQQAVADNVHVVEVRPVASAPARIIPTVVVPTTTSVIVVRDPDPLPPTVWTVPPVPVGASWKYTLPGASSPPIGADPATQWAELREQEQWTAIHKADAKASAAMVATDNLYTYSSSK